MSSLPPLNRRVLGHTRTGQEVVATQSVLAYFERVVRLLESASTSVEQGEAFQPVSQAASGVQDFTPVTDAMSVSESFAPVISEQEQHGLDVVFYCDAPTEDFSPI